MDGNRQGQRHPDRRIFQGSKKCRQAFGEIVRSNRKRRHHADSRDMAAFAFLKRRVLRV